MAKQGHKDGLRPHSTWAWLYRVYGGQGKAGELEIGPAVQSLGQELTSLRSGMGSWAMGSLGGTQREAAEEQQEPAVHGLWPRCLSDLFFSTYYQAFKGNFWNKRSWAPPDSMLEDHKLSTPCSIVSLCCISQLHLPACCYAACTSTFPGGTFLLWLMSEVPAFTFLSFFKQKPEERSGLSGLLHAQLSLTLFSFSFSPVSLKKNNLWKQFPPTITTGQGTPTQTQWKSNQRTPDLAHNSLLAFLQKQQPSNQCKLAKGSV